MTFDGYRCNYSKATKFDGLKRREVLRQELEYKLQFNEEARYLTERCQEQSMRIDMMGVNWHIHWSDHEAVMKSPFGQDVALTEEEELSWIQSAKCDHRNMSALVLEHIFSQVSDMKRRDFKRRHVILGEL